MPEERFFPCEDDEDENLYFAQAVRKNLLHELTNLYVNKKTQSKKGFKIFRLTNSKINSKNPLKLLTKINYDTLRTIRRSPNCSDVIVCSFYRFSVSEKRFCKI